MGFVLVMEYLPFGLADVIRNLNKPLTEPQIKKYMRMLLMGVAYLHGHNIMHRVCVCINFKIKICTIITVYNSIGFKTSQSSDLTQRHVEDSRLGLGSVILDKRTRPTVFAPGCHQVVPCPRTAVRLP